MDQQKIILIGDAEKQRQAQALIEADRANLAAQGKVRTSKGEVIDRARAAFRFEKLVTGEERAIDGTLYAIDDKGTRRRVTPKVRRRRA